MPQNKVVDVFPAKTDDIHSRMSLVADILHYMDSFGDYASSPQPSEDPRHSDFISSDKSLGTKQYHPKNRL